MRELKHFKVTATYTTKNGQEFTDWLPVAAKNAGEALISAFEFWREGHGVELDFTKYKVQMEDYHTEGETP
jgi:hypothetical protein